MALIPDYDQPESLEKFLMGIRKFDPMRSEALKSETKSEESVKPSELAELQEFVERDGENQRSGSGIAPKISLLVWSKVSLYGPKS